MTIRGFEVEEIIKETSEEEKKETILRIYNLLKDDNKIE